MVIADAIVSPHIDTSRLLLPQLLFIPGVPNQVLHIPRTELKRRSRVEYSVAPCPIKREGGSTERSLQHPPYQHQPVPA